MGNFLSFPDLKNSLSTPGFMFSVVVCLTETVTDM